MCSIDWTALGSCVGAGALILASVIALLQLRSFNRNERLKNTLTLIAQYSETTHDLGINNVTCTVASPC